MLTSQIHSPEEFRSFFSRPRRPAFVRCEPVRNPDGTVRKGWDLTFYCPEQNRIFVVLDCESSPCRVSSSALPEQLGVTQMAPVPFPAPASTERVVPGFWHYAALVHHMKRYFFARENLKPGTVLDCACGTGYGTNIMLQHSGISSAVGVDISESALDFSKMLVKDPRARFLPGLPEETFDNIVCLETLEHAPNPYEFLAELVRRLAPDGRLILSVPEERFFGSSLGAFHVSVWNLDRLGRFLSSFFRDVHIHYQHACGLGPDTFSAAEISSESWGPNRNEWLLAILQKPAVSRRERLVVRRRGRLGEVLPMEPTVEHLKIQAPDKDVVVVTDQMEVFFGNPNADLVVTPAWAGKVDVDLDAPPEGGGLRRLLEDIRLKASVKEPTRRPRLYLSDDDLRFAEEISANRGKQIIVCNLVASPPHHAWPERCWMELVETLRPRYSVVLFGEEGDHVPSGPDDLSFAGKRLPLSSMAAVLSKARLFIGAHNSDLSFVAAIMETPAVLLFGRADEEAEIPTTAKCWTVPMEPASVKRVVAAIEQALR